MPVLLRALILIVLACAALPAFAQAPAPATASESAKSFDDARQQIADIRKQIAANEELDDSQLSQFRDTVTAIGVQADALAADRAPKLAAIEARLAELGPAPPKGSSEAPDIAAQRTDLNKQSAALDAEIKRAKLLSVDSQQLVAALVEARRASFQATLSRRTASPLTAGFWVGIGDSLARDRARFGALRDGMLVALRDAFAADNRVAAFSGLGLGLLLLVLGRWWAERALLRQTADRVPQGHLRRSALALAIVVVTTVCTGFGVKAVVAGLGWHGAFSEAEASFAQAVVAAVFFGSFVTGLGRALLSAARPSWRLLPMRDAVAGRLRSLPFLLGGVVALSVLLKRTNTLVGASLSATIAGSLVVALLYSGLIGWGLLRAQRTRVAADDSEVALQRPAWIGLGIAALWLGVIATLAALLFGYVALAQQIARQMVGLGVIAATFYLLAQLIEDGCAALASSHAQWVQNTFGFEPRVLEQAAVVCSGVLRVILFVFALIVALAPFGAEPANILSPLGRTGAALKVGQFEFAPGALLGAIAVFVLGVLVIRVLQRWLLQRYLPTTRLDPAMGSSVTTLLGYAGGVLVFAFALSALGFGVERIAWVASALSVGIGFGLQAVVQNFVSGLILLVERPVKVGDWVVLGDVEGDIRRINVRATEIQIFDRSTVIVPNSELITKSVRNVTLANAQGRVRIRLPLPLDCDAARVRELVQAALAAHPALLPSPAPSVLLDGIEGAALILIAVGYTPSPRQAGGIRSELLFDILARLRGAGIALATPYHLTLNAPPGGGEAASGKA